MTSVWGERLTLVSILVFSGIIIWMGIDFSFGADILPYFCAFSAIILAGYLLVKTWFASDKNSNRKIEFDFSYMNLKPMIITICVIGYVFAIFILGYFTSTLVFLVIASFVTGVRDVKLIATTAIILMPLMYGFFELFLQANLPRGLLY